VVWEEWAVWVEWEEWAAWTISAATISRLSPTD
jgi:hypothetical protein